jgi:hypothetical protein
MKTGKMKIFHRANPPFFSLAPTGGEGAARAKPEATNFHAPVA